MEVSASMDGMEGEREIKEQLLVERKL